MRDALARLGYRVADYFGNDMSFQDLRDNYVSYGLELAKDYDAVQDMPWPLMYRELDTAFPGSKFIFTARDPDAWYQSMVKHFGSKPSVVRQLTYGEDHPFPEGDEEHYKSVYIDFEKEVLEYFSGRPDDFLVMNLERGDGWAELGAFLRLKDIPQGPFEHSNPAEMRDTLRYRLGLLGMRVTNKLRRIIAVS